MIEFAKIITVLVACCLLTNCSYQPQRREGIPKTSHWVGGRDGGNWVDARVVKPDSLWDIIIYNEYPGEIIDSGMFAICNSCIGVQINDINAATSAYDGQKIILKMSLNNQICYLHKVQ